MPAAKKHSAAGLSVGPTSRTSRPSAEGKRAAASRTDARGSSARGAGGEAARPEDEVSAYMTALQHQLDEVLLPTVRERLAGGAALVAPELLAERMLAVTPAPAPQNRMAEQVGPEYFDTKGVQTILAAPGASPVSKQAVEHRRHRHSLLALRTTDGRWIYPTWQFRDHEVLPGLADVLAAFYGAPAPSRDPRAGRGGQDAGHATGAERDEEAGESGSVPVRREPFSRWSVATWVTTPLADLGDVSVADWLRQGRGIDPVLQLARRVAAAWAA